MKRIAARVVLFASLCGGALLVGADAMSARLATNHCEPVVID